MNWTRGLIRLWLVVSILWISVVGWLAYLGGVVPRIAAAKQQACFEARKADPRLGNVFDCFDGGGSPFADLVPWSNDIFTYGGWAFIPPLVLLFIGILIKWVMAGFRHA
jgi:hypothetical protein